jgi:hypothetical protein
LSTCPLFTLDLPLLSLSLHARGGDALGEVVQLENQLKLLTEWCCENFGNGWEEMRRSFWVRLCCGDEGVARLVRILNEKGMFNRDTE